MRVADPLARAFCEIEAARECWSTRELEHQIASLLFERLAKSRDKAAVLDLALDGQKISAPAGAEKRLAVRATGWRRWNSAHTVGGI